MINIDDLNSMSQAGNHTINVIYKGHETSFNITLVYDSFSASMGGIHNFLLKLAFSIAMKTGYI